MTFQSGDEVYHPERGRGIVTLLINDDYVTVTYVRKGQKPITHITELEVYVKPAGPKSRTRGVAKCGCPTEGRSIPTGFLRPTPDDFALLDQQTQVAGECRLYFRDMKRNVKGIAVKCVHGVEHFHSGIRLAWMREHPDQPLGGWDEVENTCKANFRSDTRQQDGRCIVHMQVRRG